MEIVISNATYLSPQELDINGNGRVDPDEEVAQPGDLFDANPYPALIAGFEGPTADAGSEETDQWGIALSGYAPVRDWSGRAIAVPGGRHLRAGPDGPLRDPAPGQAGGPGGETRGPLVFAAAGGIGVLAGPLAIGAVVIASALVFALVFRDRGTAGPEAASMPPQALRIAPGPTAG